MQSTHKATGVGRFLWYLPHNDDFYPPPNSSEPTSYLQLERLANAATAAFVLSPGVHIDPNKLIHAYRPALHERGLLRGSARTHTRLNSSHYFACRMKSFACSK